MPALLPNLLLFSRLLRDAGIAVSGDRVADAGRALGWVEIGSRDEVYHTLRTLLVSRHEQIAAFDRAFAAFWRAATASPEQRVPQPADARDNQSPGRNADALALAMVGQDDEL